MKKTNNSVMMSGSKSIFTALLVTSLFMLTGCDDNSDSFQDSIGDTMDDVGESVNEAVDEMDMYGNVPEEITLSAELSGTPNTNAEGSGSSTVTINRETGEVCYDIEVDDIEEPTLAHIHSGAEGESGGVVVDFNVPENDLEGCVQDAEQNVLDGILETPDNYYVNVHNEPFPAGVVRGQLARNNN